ncbi:MAG: hypothetical protein LBV41_11975 [Cytophagaceae bacterium]|jgi:hypothetical protein|nr:hypothetical protein [Cytophagaceae bacterium]
MKNLLKPIACATIAIMVAAGYSCDKEENGGSNNSTTSYEFEHEGSKYTVVKKLKTWVEAAEDAVAQGGYLVEIGNQAEHDAVYKAIRDAGVSPSYTVVNDGGGVAYVWIGAMATTDRTWVWNGVYAEGTLPTFWMGNSDGVELGYANWGGKSAGSYNEPDNFTDPDVSPNGQNVAAIGMANWPQGSASPLGIAGEWNDIANTNKLYYVIEKDAEPGLPQTGGTYVATGTPSFLDTPGPATWNGTIEPQTSSTGEQWYKITNWGGVTCTVYLDFVDGKIILDDATRIGTDNAQNLDVFFGAGTIDPSTNVYRGVNNFEVKYEAVTRTLVFSGTSSGLPVLAGLVGKNRSTGVIEAVYSEQYANTKLKLTFGASVMKSKSRTTDGKKMATAGFSVQKEF